jgi:ribosomal protein S18 acetylase RimI-like enzyme
MNNELIFRTAFPEEREQLRQLGLLAYGQYAGTLSPENWEMMQQGLSSEANWDGLMNQSTPFVCAAGNQLVGMAFLFGSGNPTEIYPADWSYIRMIGIHPDYEGQGIARKLTQCCIEKAREAGEQTIALHTSGIMKAARHIYESMGFVVVNELPERFGIRYWLFSREL